jgi:hypothetical protein
MQLGERKYVFIKDYITENINPSGGYVKALITFMHIAIPKEGTTEGTKLKLMSCVGMKVRPTGATKNM